MTTRRTTISMPLELRAEIQGRQKGRETPADVVAKALGRRDLVGPRARPRPAEEVPA